MRAYREDATEAAARTTEEHIAHKSAHSDLVDTIDLSKLLTNPKSRSDHGAPSPLDFARADEVLFDNHAQSETVRIPSSKRLFFKERIRKLQILKSWKTMSSQGLGIGRLV